MVLDSLAWQVFKFAELTFLGESSINKLYVCLQFSD